MEISTQEAATVRAALECWKEELKEGGEWIADSLFFANRPPLSNPELDALIARLDSEIKSTTSCREFRLLVPRYNGNLYPRYVASGKLAEFGDPETPVLVREAEGVRIVLGSHDYEDDTKPDVQIERHPNGWMIFLHPLGGSDACGYIYFVDDGRSYFLPEYPYGPTPEIAVLERGKRVPEFDART
jgi:hypothetical protein